MNRGYDRAWSRRQVLRALAVVPAANALRAPILFGQSGADAPLDRSVLPSGVSARLVPNVNGIRMHVLEAGAPDRPAVLLVHGFPELAYSWRNVMVPLASAGYRVIAPDLRGYGRSGGTGVKFDDDLAPWRTWNEVTDMVPPVADLG